MHRASKLIPNQPKLGVYQKIKCLFGKTHNYLLSVIISGGNKDQYLFQKPYIHYFI